jgi:DNA (cytosine-5)-methyltransferase 1
MRKDNKFKVISLFCGCGGLDLGFHNAGFDITAAYDINHSAISVYNQNIKSVAKVLDLSRNTPKPETTIDVLLAGSPCQGFSVAGKRNFSDPRNSLLIRTAEIALDIKPSVVLAENVPGVLSGGHKAYWEEFEEKLKAGGYTVLTLKINAHDLGSAQRRKRVFLIGWRTGKEFTPVFQPGPTKSLRDVISDLDDTFPNHTKVALDVNSIDYQIACHIGPGMKLSNVRGGSFSVHTWDIPEVFGPTTTEERLLLAKLIKLRRQIRVRDFGDADPVDKSTLCKEFGEGSSAIISSLLAKGYLEEHGEKVDLTHTFNGKYRRLAWDKPSFTVDTYFGNPRYFLHPVEHRGFTVREAARIQGFPDSFVFPNDTKKSMEMIGNAVSPIVAERLAIIIKESLLS